MFFIKLLHIVLKAGMQLISISNIGSKRSDALNCYEFQLTIIIVNVFICMVESTLKQHLLLQSGKAGVPVHTSTF